MKITARAFNRTVSVDTCRLMWKNLLHPTINKGKWTKQEDRKLSELVDQPDEDGLLRPRKDWDKIAKKVTFIELNRLDSDCKLDSIWASMDFEFIFMT